MVYFVGALLVILVIGAVMRLASDDWIDVLIAMTGFVVSIVVIALLALGSGMVVTGQWPWEMIE